MNIEHLNQITPDLVEDAKAAWLEGNWDVWAMTYADEIIAALHAGLRLKRELDQTITTP